MLLKFYLGGKLLHSFDSDQVPRVEEWIKLGRKRYMIHSIVYRMKGNGSGFLHARINLI